MRKIATLDEVSDGVRVQTGIWFSVENVAFTVVSATHNLVINIVQQKKAAWLAVAIATPLTGKTVDDVFDNHAHKNLGTFRTRNAAMRKGETYAKKWLRSRRKLERCGCKPIKRKK